MLYDSNGIFKGVLDDEALDILKHYGTPRHSGRYPWGSGENPYQRMNTFMSTYTKLSKATDENGNKLYSEVDIAKSFGMTTGELRRQKSIATAEIYAYNRSEARRLLDKGMSKSAIARRMGVGESTVRDWLREDTGTTVRLKQKNAQLLKDRLNEVDYIQVGSGTEYYLNNATQTSLNNTLAALEKEGYTIHNLRIEQQGIPGQYTKVKVLAKPGVTTKEVYDHLDKVEMPVDIYQEDGELKRVKEYKSVDPSRLTIKYAEDGGSDRDGVIELRRGVADLDLGLNHYAQVRIKVGKDRYLKGMAMYTDDELPEGVDIRFNTSKHNTKTMREVLKETDDDSYRDNPFGANLKPEEKLTRCQRHYIDENGKEQLSALNIVKEEGDVNSWRRTLPSQFLSKQPPELAKRQLKLQYDIEKAEFDEIASYTNPTVKAKLLEEFAGQCDSDAVHLQAAALPRQSAKLILPLPSLKENEIYAPGYDDGEQVALVRFPHGGINEIPILTVNNHNDAGNSLITNKAVDAVGIHPAAAERLSGADFDGDTALVLPMSAARIQSKKQYEGLIGFNHRDLYPEYEGMHVMTDREHGLEMGKISNLITDMTIQGANEEELCRAIKHSMVIVDAKKHHLDYKRSEQENDIEGLRKIYQPKGGTTTLLSRSTNEEHIAERVEKRPSEMTPEEKVRWSEGEIIYKQTGKYTRKPDFPKRSMTDEEKFKYRAGEIADKVKVPTDSDGKPVPIGPGSEKKNANEIRALQKGLKVVGYLDRKKEINGIYDDDTMSAVKNFQKSIGVKATGKWDRATQNACLEANKEVRAAMYATDRVVFKESGRHTTVERGYNHDPYELVSGGSREATTPIERVYADHAVAMKQLAKDARAMARAQKDIDRDPAMAEKYADQVKSLNAKLAIAEQNAPREKQAQMKAKVQMDIILAEHPEIKLDKEHLSRERGQQLERARKRCGAKKLLIGTKDNPLTDKEWEAIQNGAITKTKLRKIIANADSARLRELSMPKTRKGMIQAKITRAKNMLNNGYSQAEVAKYLGVSVSTLMEAVGPIE